MIMLIYLLMEILAIILCIHKLYGKSFRLDVYGVVLIITNIILLVAINRGFFSPSFSMLNYPLIALYCMLKFGISFRKIFINNILMFILIGVTQLLCSLPMVLMDEWIGDYEVRNLVINSMVLLIFIIGGNRLKLKQLSDFLIGKELLYRIILLLCVVGLGYLMFAYKMNSHMRLWDYIVVTVFTAAIGILVMQWQKSELEAKLKTKEIEMLNSYNAAFVELLDTVRIRQHSFNQHITAVYSQHATHDTYEGLVNAQKDYCKKIENDNRFNKLLLGGNSILAGYLFGKFTEIDKMGVDVIYRVKTQWLKCKVPTFEMVEMIGVLLDNAVEEVRSKEKEKRIWLDIIEKEEGVHIQVKNPMKHMGINEMDVLFQKGYSTKGKGRGLGLARVKEICQKYDCKLSVENGMEENGNVIVFSIMVGKYTS